MAQQECPSCGLTWQSQRQVTLHLTNSPTCSLWLSAFANRPPRNSGATSSTQLPAVWETLAEQWGSSGLDFEGDVSMEAAFDVTNSEPIDEEPGRGDIQVVAEYVGAAKIFGVGADTFFDKLDKEPYGNERASNPHYPFRDHADWKLGEWLTRANISKQRISEYFKLAEVQRHPPSFNSANQLRARIEALPGGPPWKSREIKIVGYPTKGPITLYYRDSLACAASLFGNPMFAGHMDFVPRKVYVDGTCADREYTEMFTGDRVHEIQDALPAGATIIGCIAASDKTKLTQFRGNQQSHPLLFTIGNIHHEIRAKTSRHAWTCIAYIPIPKWATEVHKSIRGVLDNRIYHLCCDIVFEDLKVAAKHGTIMSDPYGQLRSSFTPLLTFIADNPEQVMLVVVAPNNSPISLAGYHQLGDPDPQPLRRGSHTLHMIEILNQWTDPWDLTAYQAEAKKVGLNGVHEPFWRDWAHTEPSLLFPPDALHQWHKSFMDHTLVWAQKIIGTNELDFRMMTQQPRVGYRHFENGISQLKQTTGKEQREIQRSLVAALEGAAPPGVVRAIRAEVDFIYLGQMKRQTTTTLGLLEQALRDFHSSKQAILDAGGRQGKHGPINHFCFPKLEMKHHVVMGIKSLGAASGYTTDITEHALQEFAKEPYRQTNRKDYESQMCRALDRAEKLTLRSMVLVHKAARLTECSNGSLGLTPFADCSEVENISSIAGAILVNTRIRNYFTDVKNSKSIVKSWAAFHLNQQPDLARISIIDVSTLYRLPHLQQCLATFFARSSQRPDGRRTRVDANIGFATINVWHSFRLQLKAIHNTGMVLPAECIQALPPSDSLPFGRCNTVFVIDEAAELHSAGIYGHNVVQIRLIFQPIMNSAGPTSQTKNIFVYAEKFRYSRYHTTDFDGDYFRVPQAENNSELFLLNRQYRTDMTHVGEIFPLENVRRSVQLIPRYSGKEADRRLNPDNCIDVWDKYLLNSYASLELFNAIHTS